MRVRAISRALILLALVIVFLSVTNASEVKAEPNPPKSTSPVVVVKTDSTGILHVVWVSRPAQGGSKGSTLWHSTYDSLSGANGISRPLVKDATIQSFDMTLDESDQMHIVWAQANPNATSADHDLSVSEGVYYSRLAANGTVLIYPRILVDSSQDVLSPSIAIGANSSISMAWTRTAVAANTTSGAELFYARIDTAGLIAPESVGSIRNESPSASVLRSPKLAYDGLDGLHMIWVEDVFRRSEVVSRLEYAKIDLDGSTVGRAILGNGTGKIEDPNIAVTADGDLVVAWTFKASNQSSNLIHLSLVSKQGELRFSKQIGLAGTFGQVNLQSITLDNEGNVYVVWLDSGPSQTVPENRFSASGFRLGFVTINQGGNLTGEDWRTVADRPSAAFALTSGELLVVSRDQIVRVPAPWSMSSVASVVVALVGAAAASSYLMTEPSVYRLSKLVMSSTGGRQRDSRSIRKNGSLNSLVRRIARNPGITLRDLARKTRRPRGKLMADLHRLEKMGIVDVARDGLRLRFYLDTDNQLDSSPTYSRDQTLRASVIREVNTCPGVSEAEIARKLAVSQQLANYHLRRLAQAKFLRGVRKNRGVAYYPRGTSK